MTASYEDLWAAQGRTGAMPDDTRELLAAHYAAIRSCAPAWRVYLARARARYAQRKLTVCWCRDCGASLPDGRRHRCDSCLPAHRRSLAAARQRRRRGRQ